MTFNHTDTVGSIVTRFPNGATVLQHHKIDYCCGGDRTLTEACTEQNINPDTVIKELRAYYQTLEPTATDWTTAPLEQLIQQILQAHHAYLYETLPTLSELTKKILRVHGAHHPELQEVFKTFQALNTEMDMHLIKEETVQYPAIEAYLASGNTQDLQAAIDVITELEDEHTNAGDALKALRQITNDYTIPNDVCNTFVTTYRLLEDLEQNTFTHIHLENNILFHRLISLGGQ